MHKYNKKKKIIFVSEFDRSHWSESMGYWCAIFWIPAENPNTDQPVQNKLFCFSQNFQLNDQLLAVRLLVIIMIAIIIYIILFYWFRLWSIHTHILQMFASILLVIEINCRNACMPKMMMLVPLYLFSSIYYDDSTHFLV